MKIAHLTYDIKLIIPLINGGYTTATQSNISRDDLIKKVLYEGAKVTKVNLLYN